MTPEIPITYDEAASKFSHLDSYFLRCREIGQGINTKETVQFRHAAKRLVELGHGEEYSEYKEMTATEYIEGWNFALEMNKYAKRNS